MAKKENINELARRYTTAAFELAKSKKALDAVSADIEKLLAALKADEAAVKIFSSPLLTAEKQVDAARELGKSMKLNEVTQNLLLVVARNTRLKNLGAILQAFADRISAENGEQKAVVISAQKLDEAVLKTLAADLGKKTGKKIIIEEKIDESIIGGVIVKVGSEMYDNSVKTQLNNVKNSLKKTA